MHSGAGTPSQFISDAGRVVPTSHNRRQTRKWLHPINTTPNTTVNLRQLLRRRREFAGFVKSHIFNYYIAKYFQKLWKQISECQRNALSLNKYVTQWEYGEDKQKCHGGKFSIGRKMRFYVGRKNSVISFKLVQRNLHSDTTNTHLLY